jgi:hypothetical protein
MHCKKCPDYPLSEAPIHNGKFCKIHYDLIGGAYGKQGANVAVDVMLWWHEWTEKNGCNLPQEGEE